MLKETACDVWVQTSSIATAQAANASGVDIIIAQGSEAGGHNRSTTGLFTLLPRMVDAVRPAPVIAAGGIADGRGMAAALCLGAAGVCVGTRLVATVESNAHDEYKRRIIEATEEDNLLSESQTPGVKSKRLLMTFRAPFLPRISRC